MTDSDKGLHILIVEDDPDDQQVLTELLRSSIIKIQLPSTAGTLEKAISLLCTTTFDVILLDLMLPDSRGTNTLKNIKEFSGNTPVIILSSINDLKIAEDAIRLGAQDYHLKKGLDKKWLIKTIFCSIEEISDRKKAEEFLKATRENYLSLVNTVDGIVWEADARTFVFSFVSERAERLLGYPVRQWLEEPDFWANHIHPDDRNWAFQYCLECTLAKESHEFEYRMIAADGRIVWLKDIVTVIVENSEAVRLRGIMIDITKQKMVEAALESSEKNLRQVLSSTADNYYVIDRNFRITLINRSAEYNLKEAWGRHVGIGTNILEVIPTEENEPIRKSLKKVFAGEKVEYELHLAKKGLPEWVLVNYKPVVDDKGVVVGAYIMSKDISEQKRIEEGLKKSIERFEMIAATTHDAIWEWNLETGEIWGNAVHQKMYGLSAADPVPNETIWLQKIHPQDREAILDDLSKALASDKDAWITEYRFLTPDGYRNIYDRSYIVRNENKKPIRIMGSMMDITERKKIEDFLRESEERNRALVENAPEALVVFDVEMRKFVSVSLSAEKLFKMTREELLQIGPVDVSPRYQPDGRLSLELAIEKINATVAGDKPHFEWTHCDKEGNTIPCEVWLVRLPSDNRILIRGSIVDITIRKQAEQAIKESEEKYRNLIEEASDPIITYSLDGHILSCNDAFVTATGYQKADIGTLKVTDLLFKEDLALKPIRFDLIKKGGAVHDQRRVRKKDGSEMPVELNSKMMPDGNIMVIARDITERTKAEELLRASEEKYRTLVEQAVDAIALYDSTGRILDVNTGSVNLLGYSKQELIGMFLQDILTEEELRTKPVRYDVLQKGESTVKQRMMKKKDGSIVQTEVRSQQLPDGRFLSVIRDLTERITAQEQIEKEKELSDSIINSLPGLFYLIDEKGNYIRWNKLKEQITGYSADEMRNRTSLDFFEGEEKELIRQKIKEGFEKGTTEVEAHIITKSGEKILFYFNGISIEYEGQRCLMGTGIDISDRKEAELELESSYKAIRQLTEHLQNIREEERTHIAREIHDELGQKLTVLKMDISWINKKISDKEEVIKTRLKELLSMLDDTVKSVRRISSELRPSLLDDLGLIAAMEWHLNEFGKRFDINTHFKPVEDIPLPEAMKTGLFRIFQESLTNVARHAGAKKVSVTLERENRSVVLSVTDDGVGFDKQNAASRKTLGILGMKERTSMIGGTYEIISKPGKGTKVLVKIPLSNKN